MPNPCLTNTVYGNESITVNEAGHDVASKLQQKRESQAASALAVFTSSNFIVTAKFLSNKRT